MTDDGVGWARRCRRPPSTMRLRPGPPPGEAPLQRAGFCAPQAPEWERITAGASGPRRWSRRAHAGAAVTAAGKISPRGGMPLVRPDCAMYTGGDLTEHLVRSATQA